MARSYDPPDHYPVIKLIRYLLYGVTVIAWRHGIKQIDSGESELTIKVRFKR